MNYTTILNNIKNKNLDNIYFVGGEEIFIINKINAAFENSILTEEEKAFNLHILYGKDIKIHNVINIAKQFPVNSKYSLVIVKNSEEIKNIENIKSYLENKNNRCVLIFCYNKKINEKKDKIWSLFKKYGTVVSAQKIYENKIPEWIKQYVKSLKYEINYKSCLMISESLGNDLTKISNEINKLIISIDNRKIIEENDIQNNIGINKDYNNYELVNSLALKDGYKSYLIANYLYEKNPNQMSLTNSILHNFFTKVLLFHSIKAKPTKVILQKMNLHNSFFLKQYSTAAINYNSKKIINILDILFEYDKSLKGISETKNNKSLIKEIIYKILN